MNFIKRHFKKQVGHIKNISGRISRQDYWRIDHIDMLIGFVVAFSMLGCLIAYGSGYAPMLTGWATVLLALLCLAMLIGRLIVSISMTIQRLHDVGKSGYFLLLVITIICIPVILIFLMKNGDKGANAYGADPLAAKPEPSKTKKSTKRELFEKEKKTEKR